MAGRLVPSGGASSFELRVLTPDDWEAWRVIRLKSLADAPYAFGSKLSDWQSAPEDRWRARLALPGSHNLVAYSGSTAVGMATGVLCDVRGRARLISMYVAPAARGTGLADALIDAVEAWARGCGASSLCLGVMADNAPARQVYERHGLVITGEEERKSAGDSIELTMCKELRG